MQAAAITGTTWLMLTLLIRLILPAYPQFIVSTSIGLILFILPIVNHVRIFLAIRRHNHQMNDAVSGQNLSIIFRREKKAAIDMLLVIGVLMLCLAPGVAINIFKGLLNDQYDVLYVWSTTLLFINSSINPVIYLVRNSDIRNAVRCMMCF